MNPKLACIIVSSILVGVFIEKLHAQQNHSGPVVNTKIITVVATPTPTVEPSVTTLTRIATIGDQVTYRIVSRVFDHQQQEGFLVSVPSELPVTVKNDAVIEVGNDTNKFGIYIEQDIRMSLSDTEYVPNTKRLCNTVINGYKARRDVDWVGFPIPFHSIRDNKDLWPCEAAGGNWVSFRSENSSPQLFESVVASFHWTHVPLVSY